MPSRVIVRLVVRHNDTLCLIAFASSAGSSEQFGSIICPGRLLQTVLNSRKNRRTQWIRMDVARAFCFDS
jgi:hypothetical protein